MLNNIIKDLKRLEVEVYAGESLESTVQRLADIRAKLGDAKKYEILLKKIALLLRNGGYSDSSQLGKLYTEIEKVLRA